MLTLAWAYLRDRPLTTALNILLLAIAVSMLVLLLQFGTQARERFERDAEGIDLVVGAKGSPLQLILSSVFHVDHPTGNIPGSSLEMLRRDPAVARVTPLALGDNFDGYRIVGTDHTFAALHRARLVQGQSFGEPMDAVLGATVAQETGARLGQRFVGSHGLESDEQSDAGHDHAPFTVTGILAPTGGVIDRLILTSVESVWQVHGIDHPHEDAGHRDHGAETHAEHGVSAHDEHGHAGEESGNTSPPVRHTPEQSGARGDEHGASERGPHAPPLQERRDDLEPELTALLVSYRNASGAIRIPAMINRQTEMQAAVPATETARLLDLVGASLDGLRMFAWLLAATGGLAVFVALLGMARNREGDLALLRVMGASRMQVFSAVILEGAITAAIGALAGWCAAHGLLALAQDKSATLRDLGLTPWQPLGGEGLLILGVIAIGVIAATFPALRVYRIDPVRTLARTN